MRLVNVFKMEINHLTYMSRSMDSLTKSLKNAFMINENLKSVELVIEKVRIPKENWEKLKKDPASKIINKVLVRPSKGFVWIHDYVPIFNFTETAVMEKTIR